jgi:hypothetical protein
MHDTIPGYPADVDPRKATTTRNQLASSTKAGGAAEAVRSSIQLATGKTSNSREAYCAQWR